MNITVFGGSGFIGKWVVLKLIEAGHKVRVVSRHPQNILNDVEYIAADIQQVSCFRPFIENSEAVIYLISTTTPKSSFADPIYDIQTNLLPFVTLLQACDSMQIKKLIFASSGGTVYGVPQSSLIDEKHPTNPIVSYGIVKLAMEKYAQSFAARTHANTIILRISNPYGEGQVNSNEQGVIAAFVAKALEGSALEIWGDGTIARDFIHIEDVANAFVKAINYKGEDEIFNISSGKEITLNCIAQNIEKVLGNKVLMHYKESRSFDVPVNVLDNKKAADILQWSPRIDLQEGLKRTIEWTLKLS